MIKAVVGLPGGGKSYYAMMLLEKELISSDRTICTNIDPLHYDKIAEYLHEKHDSSFGIHSRIRTLEPSQIPKFWLYRGSYVWTQSEDENLPKKNGKAAVKTNFSDYDSGRDSGCFYLLDEVHVYFNARLWAQTGKDALDYFSQHRKFRDDIVWISQRPKQVESQLRDLSEAFVYLKNQKAKSARFCGLTIKQGSSMKAVTYDGEKKNGPEGDSQIAMAKTAFKVDPKLYGSWYDTGSGAGVKGGAADKTLEGAKGLPMWIVFVLLLAIPAGIAAVAYGVNYTAASKANAYAAGSTTYSDQEAAEIISDLDRKGLLLPQQVSPSVPPEPTAEDDEPSDPSFSPGRIQQFRVARDGFIWIELDDGSHLSSSTHNLRMLGKRGFMLDGKVYPLP